jgi:hypothetical protein
MSQVTVACILGAVFVALCLVVWDMIEVQQRGHK